MTPKEKALSLCQRFGNTTLFVRDCNDGETLPLRVAKLCALIALDEMKSTRRKGSDYDYTYWDDVEKEIENL